MLCSISFLFWEKGAYGKALMGRKNTKKKEKELKKRSKSAKINNEDVGPGPAQLANSTGDEVTGERGWGGTRCAAAAPSAPRGEEGRGRPTCRHPCRSSRGVEVRLICSPPHTHSPQLVPFRLPQKQSKGLCCDRTSLRGTVKHK